MDKTDALIMAIVSEQAMWKQKIADEVQDNYEDFANATSYQAIGRRVNQLSDDGWLEVTFVRHPETGELMQSFKPSEKGQDVVDGIREVINQNT